MKYDKKKTDFGRSFQQLSFEYKLILLFVMAYLKIII